MGTESSATIYFLLLKQRFHYIMALIFSHTRQVCLLWQIKDHLVTNALTLSQLRAETRPGTVAQNSNFSTQEAEARGF